MTMFMLMSAAMLWAGIPAGAETPEIRLDYKDSKVVARGRLLYRQHCANCHGAKLEGQPNWRKRDADGYLPAPPHDKTGHTWHHSDKLLFELTKYGLAKVAGMEMRTRMPAYEDVLSDREIIAVLSFIKSRWPDEIRKRHDRLNAAAKPK